MINCSFLKIVNFIGFVKLFEVNPFVKVSIVEPIESPWECKSMHDWCSYNRIIVLAHSNSHICLRSPSSVPKIHRDLELLSPIILRELHKVSERVPRVEEVEILQKWYDVSNVDCHELVWVVHQCNIGVFLPEERWVRHLDTVATS
jgi:hypothetical protein